MNAKDFDNIVGARLNWCEKTLCAKGDEYARDGDRLWNFKAAGRKRNQHPAQALAGMEVKHDVSVDDIIDGLARGIVPPKELVAEKIGDSINYLLLLEGLIEEERCSLQGPAGYDEATRIFLEEEARTVKNSLTVEPLPE